MDNDKGDLFACEGLRLVHVVCDAVMHVPR